MAMRNTMVAILTACLLAGGTQTRSDGERCGDQQPTNLCDGRSHKTGHLRVTAAHDGTAGTFEQRRIYAVCPGKKHLRVENGEQQTSKDTVQLQRGGQRKERCAEY